MKIECDLAKLQSYSDEYSDYDWKEVFKREYATPVIFSKVPAEPFSREDVVEVIASVNGENDGPSWVMVGKLKDGRYFKIDANCDYTGWG